MNTLKNRVQLIGNLGKAPILSDDKKVCKFTLATNMSFKNAAGERQTRTDWHNITAFGKTGEIIAKYATKGSEVGITGSLSSSEYTDKDGNKAYNYGVVADEIVFMDKAPSNTEKSS